MLQTLWTHLLPCIFLRVRSLSSDTRFQSLFKCVFFIVFFGDVVQILDNGGSQEFSLRSETRFFKCGNRKTSTCCKIRVEGWVWQRQDHHTVDYQDWNCFERNAGVSERRIGVHNYGLFRASRIHDGTAFMVTWTQNGSTRVACSTWSTSVKSARRRSPWTSCSTFVTSLWPSSPSYVIAARTISIHSLPP